MRWLAVALVAVVLLWTGALLWQRRALRLERHLARSIPLPFRPLGRPAVHPDGRIFLINEGDQLVALERSGQLSWNKRLPGAVTPQPVLVRSDLLVLQGAGRLYGYTLGGEPVFTIDDLGEVGDLPCADERGQIYLLDGQGGLAGYGPRGEALFRTSLGLLGRRQLAVLRTGQLLAAGTGASGQSWLALGEPSGVVVARRLLVAAHVGLAASPRPGELAAVSLGAEVLVLGLRGEVQRRVPLPGPAASAPLLLADGAVYAFVTREGVALCRAGGACVPLLPEAPGAAPLPYGPLLGRDGRVYAAFHETGGPLFPAVHGVVSLGPDGHLWRQALPAAVAPWGLTLTWGGVPLVQAEGERYLWEFAGSQGLGAYHPWPLPAGNPAGSGRPWPERP